jgi:nitroreductase
MDRRKFVKTLSGVPPIADGETDVPSGLQTITLLPPEKDGGRSVLASLWARRTQREIGPEPLPPQMFSNLLWAAFGVNRREGGLRGNPGRTAASASNSQEIDLYVALPEGVYLYEAGPHRLAPVAVGDFRSRSWWASAETAPVNIFFIADLARYVKEGQPDPHIDNPEVQKSYFYLAVGSIAANIYLFAASQGLAAWLHNCDTSHPRADFRLRPEQRVLFAQTVGYPAKS